MSITKNDNNLEKVDTTLANIIRNKTKDQRYITESTYKKTYLGKPIVFYLPSIKVKSDNGKRIEGKINIFLLKEFGGYTAEKGSISGFWMDGKNIDHTDHIKYTVAVNDTKKIKELESFIADIGKELSEKAIYFEMDNNAWLIYPKNDKK